MRCSRSTRIASMLALAIRRRIETSEMLEGAGLFLPLFLRDDAELVRS